MNNKGFTILEVLISLVILSMIAIVSSNILKSSLETEQETSLQLNSIKELNLASTIIRRDLRQIVNINSKDFYGNNLYGNFISQINSQSLIFNSNIKIPWSMRKFYRDISRLNPAIFFCFFLLSIFFFAFRPIIIS